MGNKMNIGWIGLGAMGRPMAANLANAGKLNVIWNRSAEKAGDFVKEFDVIQAQDPEALASTCDLVFICITADKDLNDIINKIKPVLKPGSIIVDHSTVSASTSKLIAEELKGMQVTFLDAPVSGGVEGAKKASLVIMVGGEEEGLKKVLPILKIMASSVVYMGESGKGQATKAVNQIMAAGINQAVSEALAFGEAMQLDMKKVIDVVGGGAAANWFLDHRGQTMIDGKFDVGFKLALHHKDLTLCKQMMAELAEGDKGLPIVEMTLIHYQRLMAAGYGDEDISSLYRLKKELFTADE